MSFQAECPHCTVRFEAKDHLAGKKVRCPRCKEPFKLSPGDEDIPVAKVAKPKKPKGSSTEQLSEEELLIQIKNVSASGSIEELKPEESKSSSPSNSSASGSNMSLDELMDKYDTEPKKSSEPTATSNNIPTIVLPHENHIPAASIAASEAKVKEAPKPAPPVESKPAEEPVAEESTPAEESLNKDRNQARVNAPDERPRLPDPNDDLESVPQLRQPAKGPGKPNSGNEVIETDEDDLRLDDEELKLENWTSLKQVKEATPSKPGLEKEDSRVFELTEVDWLASPKNQSKSGSLSGAKSASLTTDTPGKFTSLAGIDPAAAHKIKVAARKITGGEPTEEEIQAVSGTESIIQLSQAIHQPVAPEPVEETKDEALGGIALPESIPKSLDELKQLPKKTIYGIIGGVAAVLLVIILIMSSGGGGGDIPIDPNFIPTRVKGFKTEHIDPSGMISVRFPTPFEEIAPIEREWQNNTLFGAKVRRAGDAFFILYTDSLPGTPPAEGELPTPKQWEVFGMKKLNENNWSISDIDQYKIGEHNVYEYTLNADIARARYGKTRLITFFTGRRMFLVFWSGINETEEVEAFLDSLTIRTATRESVR